MVALNGLILDDPGCREVEALRGRVPVALVAPGPGRSPEAAFEALHEESYRRGGRLLRLARPVREPNGWMEELTGAVAGALGLEEADEPTLQSLLLQSADRLQVPSTIVIPVGRAAARDILPELLQALGSAALLTRDLSGPVGFLVLLDGICTPAPSVDPFAWRSLHGSARVLSPSLTASFSDAIFETYFALRVFWAAAGQPRWIDEITDSLPGAGEYGTCGDPDRRLDADLDRVLRERIPRATDFVAALHWALADPAARRAFLSRGSLTSGDPGCQRLAAAGVTWSPPGSLRDPVTLAACLRLSEDGALADADGKGPDVVAQLARSARRNHLIGTWVLSLTSQIETELVDVLRASGRWRRVFDDQGWSRDLEREKRDHPVGLAADQPSDLLDFASFYQLQRAAEQTGSVAHLGLTNRSVDVIRRVRNLAAHQHVVTWSAVRVVAEAIEKVASQRC